MAEFINTIDILGDDGLATALVEKTLPEEFCDDSVTRTKYLTIGRQPMLKRLILPNVATFEAYSIGRNPSLETVIAPKLTSIYASVFNGCSSLKSLVIANTALCLLDNASAFNGTKIAYGTGYIYVPAALIDSYKAATNWSTFADQFRVLEDYTIDGTTTGELDETKI